MAPHYEQSLQRDITRIREKVSRMATLATNALEAVLKALAKRDRQVAYTVILRDRRIDELENEIDRLCLEFIVRQQPVAKHLRFAYIAIKINQDIERVGDYAESIARQVLKISSIGCDVPLARFEQIAGLSIPMFKNAVRAFMGDDVELARQTITVEDAVDGLKSTINGELFHLRQTNQLPLEALTPLMTIARRFERVADHATSICEEVIYMVTGEHTRHVGGDVWRMLFIDDDNASLSQMAEAIGNSLAQPSFVFGSAGLVAHAVDPDLVSFLNEKGLDVSHATPRVIEQVPNIEFTQVMVALTTEAKRAFVAAPKAVCLDWSGLANPQPPTATVESKRAAYEAAYAYLQQNIADLCNAVITDKLE
jgi:phosphate transport system protein